jgi:hypothetical protein
MAVKIKLDDAVVCEHWARFVNEYSVEEGDLKEDAGFQKNKRAILAGIKNGFIEIEEDAKQGIVIRQHLLHVPDSGFTDGKPLIYRAPNASDISRAGIGKEDRTVNMRYVSIAAALTDKPDHDIMKLYGPDRARMEAIAALFLSM